MAINLTQAQAQLDAWLGASLALAAGKEHQIADRRIRLEDGPEVRAQISFWQRQVSTLTAVAAGASGGSSSYALASFADE
jgi:hypothetical protein